MDKDVKFLFEVGQAVFSTTGGELTTHEVKGRYTKEGENKYIIFNHGREMIIDEKDTYAELPEAKAAMVAKIQEEVRALDTKINNINAIEEVEATMERDPILVEREKAEVEAAKETNPNEGKAVSK